jgi:putative membrane protein insertion efficiency factor
MTSLTSTSTSTSTPTPAPTPVAASPSSSTPPFEVSAASNRQPWSRRGALFLLKAYQGAASGRVSTCRYYPSCSNYAMEAFSVHGFWRAFGLTARRLLRCRPFGPHGIDLVPLPNGAAEAVQTHHPHHPHDRNEAAEATQATEVRQPC